jgi:hypothetical protein
MALLFLFMIIVFPPMEIHHACDIKTKDAHHCNISSSDHEELPWLYKIAICLNFVFSVFSRLKSKVKVCNLKFRNFSEKSLQIKELGVPFVSKKVNLDIASRNKRAHGILTIVDECIETSIRYYHLWCVIQAL